MKNIGFKFISGPNTGGVLILLLVLLFAGWKWLLFCIVIGTAAPFIAAKIRKSFPDYFLKPKK